VALSILALVAVAGVAAFFIWERNDMARAMIEGDLKRRRATDVDIVADWFDFDRDTLTYDVVYTDAAGKRVRNRAKLAFRPLADSSVFWQQPF
jgi:hypothetical protein